MKKKLDFSERFIFEGLVEIDCYVVLHPSSSNPNIYIFPW